MRHDWVSWFFFQRRSSQHYLAVPVRHRKCVDLMIMKKGKYFELSSQRELGILDTKLNNNDNYVAKYTRDNGLELGITGADFFRKGEQQLKKHYPSDVLLTTSNPRGMF